MFREALARHRELIGLVRRNWRSAGFWRWWWRSVVPLEFRFAVYVVSVGLMLGGGLLAARSLGSASASPSSTWTGPFIVSTTVQKVVTVRERGRIVRKVLQVPVARRVYVTETTLTPEYITSPGSVTTVRRNVVVDGPVVRRAVVTVGGATTTVTVSRFVPTTTVETRTEPTKPAKVRTVTTTAPGGTVTTVQVSTATNDAPGPAAVDAQTTTVTQRVTTTQPVTSTETVSIPPTTNTATVVQTKTVIVPVTVTKTQTETDLVTVTVAPPPAPSTTAPTAAGPTP